MTSRTNLRLVSFDNGGARGLSQLEIMSNIMHRLNWGTSPNEIILPCQHFDLIGGSGTGGLIAIMLAKLCMTPEEAAEEFSKIVKNVFALTNITPTERTQSLRSSLEHMMTQRGLPVDMKLVEETSANSCACFVVASPLANFATKFCLRSYLARGHRADTMTVIEAALATCATTQLFEPVTVGIDYKRKVYAGVGLGANNPIREVISEAHSLFGGVSTVESLLSIGAGHPGIITFKSNGGNGGLDRFMEEMMKDCTQKAKEVEDQIGRAGVYFRFSVEHGMQASHESEAMDVAWIVTQTESYLEEQGEKLEGFTQTVGAPAPVVTVDQLRSGGVPTVPDRISSHAAGTELEAAAKFYDEVMLTKLRPLDLERGAPVGECMEGTREDILENILNWISDPTAPNIFWLIGHPGVGKSAIASSLIEKLQAMERLGSSFFFQRDKSSSMTPTSLWRTVAYYLARQYPAVRRRLMAILTRDEAILTTVNADRLFREIILTPMTTCEEINEANAPVIVIDALDECGGLEGQRSDHRVALMRTLKTWSTLPKKFKLVVTSRAESDIIRLFSTIQHRSFEILSGNSVHPKSSEDIGKFLEHTLGQIATRFHGALPPDWPGRRIIMQLTQIAAGMFIWVVTAIRFLEMGEPQEQLHRILSGTGMGGLATLYSSILSASFVEPSKKVLESFYRIVGTIILAKDPFPASSLAAFCSVDPSVLRYICNGLQPVMETGELLRFSHQSFVDFLIDSNRNHSVFSIDLQSQKQEFTLACLQAMKTHLRFNICDVKSSYNRNKDIVDIELLVKERILHHISYSAHYWTRHLVEAEFDTEILGYVEYFMNNQFLFWLEVLSLTKRVNLGTSMMVQLIDWLRKGRQDDKMARDMKKFVATFGSAISQSAPHIYLSALPFAPRHSTVFRQYITDYQRTIRTERGGLEGWPAIQNILEGHTFLVASVAFSPDGTRIVSGSEDTTLRVWDAETAEMIAGPFEGHRKTVNSVSFSPDGTRIVSSSWDNTIRVWDAQTTEMVTGPFGEYAGPFSCVAFSPDGTQIISGCNDGVIRIWDAETAEMVTGPFEGHTDRVTAVAFSPDRSRLVSGSDDWTVRVWDVRTAEMVTGLFEGHINVIRLVAFSPDGTHIISGSDDATALMWDVRTAEVVAEIVEEESGWFVSVTFSPDRTHVAFVSDENVIWVRDIETTEMVAGPFEGHADMVTSVAFSPDGTRVVSGSEDMTIRVWDAETTESIAGPFEGHSGEVSSVAFSPDGTRLVSGSRDTTIRVWDAQTAEMVAGPFEGHTDAIISVAFSPDGTRVVSGSEDKTLRVWDVKTAEMVTGPFKGHTDWVSSVSFSPDGTRIISGSGDNKIRLWDAETAEMAVGPFKGHTHVVTCVAFSPDGARIVSGSEDKTILIWNAETSEIIAGPFEGHTNLIFSVAFSPDGTHIASGSCDKTVLVWDTETVKISAGPFEGHTDWISSVAFSPDGVYIVSGSHDMTIRIWDATTSGMVVGPLKGHTKEVSSVAFSPDGRRIVSASHDKTIRVWGSQTMGRLPASFNEQAHPIDTPSFLLNRGDAASGAEEQTNHVHETTSPDSSPISFTDTSTLVDGWMLGPNNELLFWVPPAVRTGLYRPSNVSIIDERRVTKLNLENFVHGESWSRCKDRIPRNTDRGQNTVIQHGARLGGRKRKASEGGSDHGQGIDVHANKRFKEAKDLEEGGFEGI